MTIYTITVVNENQGWIAAIETHLNKQTAKKRFDHLEQFWNRSTNIAWATYYIEMHTTEIKSAQQ